MKIWFDSTLLSLENSRTSYGQSTASADRGDCSNDCDCDCARMDYSIAPSGIFPLTLTPDSESITHLSTHTLKLNKALYTQPSYDAHWLICDPTGTGKIAVVDTEVYTLLKQFGIPRTVQEVIGDRVTHSDHRVRVIALLAGLGFLQDTCSPAPIRQEASNELLSAWLHVTNSCNLGCNYCYIQKSSEHISDDTALRAVDAIIRSATRNHFKHIKIKYSGGEASLQLAQILAIHEYAKQQASAHHLGFSASILSNGVFLSQRTIEQFKAHHIHVMISLDGVGEHHDRQRPFLNGKGSFHFVDRTITQLLAQHLVPHINVTISQRNLDGLPNLLTYILQRDMPFTLSYYRDNECSTNIRDLQFAETQMITGMQAAFDVIEQHLPKRRLIGSLIDKANMTAPHHHACSAGQSYLVIDQRGGVAKCQADIQHPVTTIDATDPLHVLRKNRQGIQVVDVDEKEGCRNCEWRYWCSGGCPLLTYRLTGRNDIKSPNCAIYKALFPEALRLEALRLLKYESPVILERELTLI